jgi:hypothetical protein
MNKNGLSALIGRTAARTRYLVNLHHNFSKLIPVQAWLSGLRRPDAPFRLANWRGWFKRGKICNLDARKAVCSLV